MPQACVLWQSWAPERTAYVRFFAAAAIADAFPEFPDAIAELVSAKLPPETLVAVLFDADNDSAMKLLREPSTAGTLSAAIAAAAEHRFVVASIQ